MDIILEALNAELESLARLTPRLAAGLALLLVAVLVGRMLGVLTRRILARRDGTERYARTVSRLFTWLVGLLGLVLAMHAWGLTALGTSVLATGGLMAVALGFAFREIGENLLAGFLLAFSRSFDEGDVIESEGYRGRVQSIELRHVHIRTADGCDIFIPSAAFFRSPLKNYTRDGLQRGRFTVGIDYEDDSVRALEASRSAPA